ncbi:hypothetical protein JCM19992_10440 [Thermostilla marina]
MGTFSAPLPAHAATLGPTTVEATYKLFHPKSTATCFLLREHADGAADDSGSSPETVWLVTAAHVLKKTEGESAVLVLREKVGPYTYERRDHPITIRRDGEPLWTKHPKFDTAVLKLESLPDFPVAALPVDVLADDDTLQAAGVDVACRVYVIGYPSRVESNGAGFPIVRSGIVAGYPIFPASEHPIIQVDFHTFEGDSGGPVFVASDASSEHPLLLGLTMGYVRFDEKITSVYEERTVHHPLNLGMIIRATIIRETLELARNGTSKDGPEE